MMFEARKRRRAGGFTLVELMVVVVIIAIVSAVLIVALASAQEDARAARTKAQIAKIHEYLIRRWDEYQSRTIPVRMPTGTSPQVAADYRVNAIRELMRMELPDRISDVEDPAVHLAPPYGGNQGPASWMSYRRRVAALGGGNLATGFSQWKQAPSRFEGAECLYMILASIQDDMGGALDHFSASEIGDVDGDGMPEVLDAWGTPIEFLRWAPGFRAFPGDDGVWGTDNGGTNGDGDDNNDGIIDNTAEAEWAGSDDLRSPSVLHDVSIPDPLDPLKRDPRWEKPPNQPDHNNDPFALFPLIYSAGSDKEYGIVTDNDVQNGDPPHRYSLAAPLRNDPYTLLPNSAAPVQITTAGGYQINAQIGARFQDSNGNETFQDNIHNHSGVSD